MFISGDAKVVSTSNVLGIGTVFRVVPKVVPTSTVPGVGEQEVVL